MAEHRIYPHGMPEQLSEGVWWVRGTLGFPLHRNMIVVRLPTGELLLHSVVALDESGMKALEGLGKPTYAIVPHTGHMMDIGFYKSRYPELKVLCPAVHRAAVEARVPVFGTVEHVLPQFGFSLHEVPATRTPEYFYEFPLRSGGRMAMGCDALGSANMSDRSRAMGRLMALTGAPGNKLGVTRLYRLAMARDVAALRQFAARLAEIPNLKLLTVSHGDPVTHDPARALREAAAAPPPRNGAQRGRGTG
jgi:hypothetical protein